MQALEYGTVARASRRCTIRLRDGRKTVLTDQHFLGLGRFEDRTQTYVPFVQIRHSRPHRRTREVRWKPAFGGECYLTAIASGLRSWWFTILQIPLAKRSISRHLALDPGVRASR